MKSRLRLIALLTICTCIAGIVLYAQWTALPVDQDPLVRMPGTQPGQVSLEGPDRCMNCHSGYNTSVEPGYNWRGSMMAQAARDPLFWATLTVAAQDSIHVLGNPNAVDLCERCHFPEGWLEGRSDPPNASAMTRSDFDGVHCDFCHRMWDPHFETTYSGSREGSLWDFYWDETNLSSTPSSPAAASTYSADAQQARNVRRFDGSAFFSSSNEPFSPSYTEAGSGQYFVSADSAKRASFADASARHKMEYSRFHKSKYFCASCHDVSNPVLANLPGGNPLPTELQSAFSYFHVERTFSEFMLSAYGADGGAPGIGPFQPAIFTTSLSNNYIARCQDCHMRDVVGAGADKNNTIIRPDGSIEHPKSGQPLHDLTGGNVWVSYLLASAVSGSPNYDAGNASLLGQGANRLTLDLNQGLGIDPVALLSGVDRARQQLLLAASIENVTYNSSTGLLSFRIQNQTGHKLISGFPEGRRMFVNVRAYSGGNLMMYEVNPYDTAAATLKGLGYAYQSGFGLPAPGTLGAQERYVDQLVYEMKPSSSITGETTTFHFVLGDDRHKDNRIPPKGFRIAEAPTRLSQPRWAGNDAAGYFTSAEYAGGYDDVSIGIPAGADYVEVKLFYQTTSREYVEFLRDEINGNPNNLTLPSTAYVAQTDPFFSKLRAWGDTMWHLWLNNREVPGAAPFLMTEASWGALPAPACDMPGTPANLTATGGNRRVTLSWSHGSPAPTGGYLIFYDQAGKRQFVASVGPGTTSYADTKLDQKTEYCYVVTAWNDCNGNGRFDMQGGDTESAPSPVACARTR
jgi:hypothetical protein